MNYPKRLYPNVWDWVTLSLHICLCLVGRTKKMVRCDYISTNVISFHTYFIWGKFQKGWSNSFYAFSKIEEPGNRLHQFSFCHGNLQIGLFNRILHGVDGWEDQMCGIQWNIKMDLLKYFIWYDTYCYDKYRLTGYPQDLIVYY